LAGKKAGKSRFPDGPRVLPKCIVGYLHESVVKKMAAPITKKCNMESLTQITARFIEIMKFRHCDLFVVGIIYYGIMDSAS
jgi:hypothetical protein